MDRAATKDITAFLDGNELIGTLPLEKINWNDMKEDICIVVVDTTS